MRTPRKYAWLLMATTLAMGAAFELPTSAAEDAHQPHSAGTEAHGADAHGGGNPNPLTVDPDLAIWTGVVFVVLLFVVGKFAWPAISAALEEREKRIEDNLAAHSPR